jgi:hypothetical protein
MVSIDNNGHDIEYRIKPKIDLSLKKLFYRTYEKGRESQLSLPFFLILAQFFFALEKGWTVVFSSKIHLSKVKEKVPKRTALNTYTPLNLGFINIFFRSLYSWGQPYSHDKNRIWSTLCSHAAVS